MGEPIEEAQVRAIGRGREIVLYILMSIGIAGCDREQTGAGEGSLSRAAEAPPSVDIGQLRESQFLTLVEGDVAALWLALKEQGDGNVDEPPADLVAEYEALLRDLATRLLEDRRMIANRTVQTRDELAEHGIRSGIGELLVGLQSVAQAGVVGNYGTYCDYYINLRQRPLGHEQSLAEMKALRVLSPLAGGR